MAQRKTLRAVPDGEQPAKRERLTVSQAAETGDHRELLVSMRDRISRTVSDPDCPPRDLAALTRRLQEIAKEIAAIDLAATEDSARESDEVDDSFDASAV